MSDSPCPRCGAPRSGWPMAHRGDKYCSQLCAKNKRPEPEPAQPQPPEE